MGVEMISSRVFARVLCASAGFLLLAGSARAQYEECPLLPEDVPAAVYDSIIAQADGHFGEVSQKTCDSIVKRGLANCKAQVKAAYKCGLKTAASNYEITLKQCATLTDAVARADCKDTAKMLRDFNIDGYRNSMQNEEDPLLGGLAFCDNQFVTALNGACMGILVKVGGP
jgi:hypothetical protein